MNRCDCCSQVWRLERNIATRPGERKRGLQSFCQFVGKCATGRRLAIFAAAPSAIVALRLGRAIAGGGRGCRLVRATRRVLTFWWLCGIGAQQPVFQRGAVEAADDGRHFVGSGCFDKCESLGFLRFVIADYFNGIGHEIFGGQPLLDVIGSDPRGQIAKKNGKAHSVDC